MIDKSAITMHPLSEFLTEYKEINADNQYRPVAVGRFGIRTRESIYSKELAKEYSKNKLIYKGTLTVGMGSAQMDIGILSEDKTYSVSPAYHTYKIAGVDYDYLRYCLQCRNSDMFVRYMKRGSRQGKSIDLSRWIKYEIPVYPFDMQLEIVNRLKRVKTIIDMHQQQLQKLDDLVKARFVEMFVNNTASDWPCNTIADISKDMRTGPFGSALHHDEFVDSGVFVLGIDNAVENKFSYNRMRYITEEKYLQLKRYTVHPGDVIITIMGTVGRSAVIPSDIPKAINTKHLACITPDIEKIDPQFLSCAFQIHPDIRLQLQKQCKGAIMDGLNLTIIKRLSFCIPPLEQQRQFVNFVIQVDKSRFVVQQAFIHNHFERRFEI